MWAAVPLLFVTGCFGTVLVAGCNTATQLTAPDDLRGRPLHVGLRRRVPHRRVPHRRDLPSLELVHRVSLRRKFPDSPRSPLSPLGGPLAGSAGAPRSRDNTQAMSRPRGK